MASKYPQGENQLPPLIKRMLSEEPSQYTIAILISSFLRSEGASRVAELQARELSGLGYSVVVYTFESDIIPMGYNVEVIDSSVLMHSPRLNKLYRALFPFNLFKSLEICSNLKNISLIILHQETLVTTAYLAKRSYNIKLIFWHHHITEPTFMRFGERLYNLIISPFNWRNIKKFDLIVSISNHSRVMLQRNKNIDSIVIYDKIDSVRFNEGYLNRTSIREGYMIGPDDPVILFVGRITPTKNIHSLISAFKIVTMSIPSAKLIIVGKIYDEVYSEGLVKACDDNVFFTGFVPDEELPSYYAACDVYATCSLVEGFNMPLVEAQACGKPVVAFDIGPHKEVVRSGFLVDQGNIDKFGAVLIQVLNVQK